MKKFLSVLLVFSLVAILAACNNTTSSSTGGATSGSSSASGSSEPAAGGSMELQIGQVEAAPHGERSFAVTTAVVEGDTVVKAHIEEYQFMAAEGTTGVPNSDGEFNASVVEGMVLGNKRVNNESYSANMAERGGSTISLEDNIRALEAHVEGKTIAELETEVSGTNEEVVEAVADCTLEDAKGYIQSVIDAAKAAQSNPTVAVEADAADLKLGYIDGAAHGDRSFTVAAALTDGDNILLSYIDEFQFMAADGSTGVPNSDGEFNASVVDGMVLGSKRVNNESYSANMSERGGATLSLEDNFDAVQNFANGKAISEIETTAEKGKGAIDDVADCTLEDTAGYLQVIVDAANVAY